jgi:hypothetical protein
MRIVRAFERRRNRNPDLEPGFRFVASRSAAPSGRSNQCRFSIHRGEAELPYLTGAALVFNSTKINSKGWSPRFSGRCSPAFDHWTDPAFTGAS